MKKFISLLLVALLLCGVCGVQAFAEDEPIWGVYTMIDMDDGETENAAELLAMMASMGMAATLTINEDGSAVMEMYGEQNELFFNFDTQTAEAGDAAIPYVHEGDTLTLSQDGLTMVFSKAGFPEKTGVGVFSYYELVGYTDADGNDFSEDFAKMREEGNALKLTVFDAGDAVFDNLGDVRELRFDFENMTLTSPGVDEAASFTLEDGILTITETDGSVMRFELCDPGWAGDYQVIALSSEEGDMTEQLAMLSAMGMAPSLSIGESGDGLLNLFGVEVNMHFDFDTMIVSSPDSGEEMPFSYELGKLSMESEGNYMVFARAVVEESAFNLADMIGAAG